MTTTAAIPELAQACRLHDRVEARRHSTAQDERDYRALLLKAVQAGATREQIMTSCAVSQSFLDAELKKARAETTDPTLKKARLPHRGLTLGEYWCPEKGCARAKGNGNEPLASAQARALHRVKMHNYRLGAKALTASMVRRARANTTTPTSELARRWEVSYHALRSARAGKTWKSLS